MVEKIKKPDFWNKVFSVLIAVGLWFFVAYSENPQTELWFNGIQITYLNESTLADKELVRVKSEQTPTVSIKVRGNRSAILSLTAADIVATVDLSTVRKAADNSLPISVKFPIDGLTTVDKKPYNIKVKTEKIISKNVNIEIIEEGKIKEGFAVEKYTPTAESIKITGGESIVKNISGCVARVDVSDLSGDKTVQSVLEVKYTNGEIKPPEEVRLSGKSVEVEIKVNAIKEVPLKAVISSLWEEKIEIIKLSPEKVKISGKRESIEKISEIKTQPITAKGESKKEKTEAELVLPEGVTVNGTDKIYAEITLKEDPAKNE